MNTFYYNIIGGKIIHIILPDALFFKCTMSITIVDNKI